MVPGHCSPAVIHAEIRRRKIWSDETRQGPQLGEVEKVVGPVGHREPPNRLLIPQFANMDAVKAWRNQPEHRMAQKAGRGGIFRDYRLRVASVLRDYGMNAREQVPADLSRS